MNESHLQPSFQEVRIAPRTATPRSPTKESITTDDVGVGAAARRDFLRRHFRHFYGGDVEAQPTQDRFFAAGKFSDGELELMSNLIDRKEFL